MTRTALVPRIRSAIFELTSRDPEETPRRVLWILCGLIGLLVLWATLARLDIVAVAEGRLVPETYVKIVQPAEAGIVKDILVREGEHVAAGQPLLRLDATVAAADRRSVGGELALKRLELRRVEAQLEGQRLAPTPSDDAHLLAQVQLDASARERAHRDQIAQEVALRAKLESELAAAQEMLTKLERTLPSYEETASAYEQLAQQKLIGRLDAQARKREAVERAQDRNAQIAQVASLESSIRAQERKLAQLESAYRADLQAERTRTLGEIARLIEEATKQGFREGLLDLRAPQAGVVKDLATTTLGAVVQPGTVLVTLVPNGEPLVAEVMIRNSDIGFVAVGQPVRIKVAAYPFTKYGMLEGTVETISADAVQVEESPRSEDAAMDASSFKAVIALASQRLAAGEASLPIAAGMQVSAEIREGQRTVLEYLLSPVRRVASEAGEER